MSSTRVDGDAGLADIAHHARMVAVIAAMGGEIEGDRHALLPGGQRLAVEGVRSPRRWRSRHIAGSSRAGRHTSWPARPRVKGARPGSAAQMRQARHVGRGIERLDRDAFQRVPGQAVRRLAPSAPSRPAPAQAFSSSVIASSFLRPARITPRHPLWFPRALPYIDGQRETVMKPLHILVLVCLCCRCAAHGAGRAEPAGRRARSRRPRSALDDFLWLAAARRGLCRHARTIRRFLRQMERYLAPTSAPLDDRDVVVITDTDPAARTAVRQRLRPARAFRWC